MVAPFIVLGDAQAPATVGRWCPKKGKRTFCGFAFCIFRGSDTTESTDQVGNVYELPYGWDFPTSWQQFQKPLAKQAALQICIQLLIPKNLSLTS